LFDLLDSSDNDLTLLGKLSCNRTWLSSSSTVFIEEGFGIGCRSVSIVSDALNIDRNPTGSISFIEDNFQVTTFACTTTLFDRTLDDFLGEIVLFGFEECSSQSWVHRRIGSLTSSDLDELTYFGIVL
jgi:hypothetical protein